MATPALKFNPDLEAHVVGIHKREHKKRKRVYVVYSVEISFAAAHWVVYRRFSDFYKFNTYIKNAFPTLRFMKLPSRLKRSLEMSFLEKRRCKLNSYLIDVLDQVPLFLPILKCDIILNFLEVMKNLQKHFAMDKRTKGREFFPDLYASFPFDRKVINLSIQHGMDQGEPIPILIAAKEGNVDEISTIIRANQDSLFTTDYWGQNALHVASRHGQAPVVRILLLQGVDRNHQDKRGWTALHCACTSADVQTVVTLLEDEGVVPNRKNVDGNTPLHYFTRNFGSADFDMVRSVLTLFIQRGADVNEQNKSGETPLHHACWRGYTNLVEALLCCGANPNIITINGESALHWAVRENKARIVQLLIQHGVHTDIIVDGNSITLASLQQRFFNGESGEDGEERGEEKEERGEGEDDFDEMDGGSEGESDFEEIKQRDKKKLKNKLRYESDSSLTPPSSAASSPPTLPPSSPSHSSSSASSSFSNSPPPKFVFASFHRSGAPAGAPHAATQRMWQAQMLAQQLAHAQEHAGSAQEPAPAQEHAEGAQEAAPAQHGPPARRGRALRLSSDAEMTGTNSTSSSRSASPFDSPASTPPRTELLTGALRVSAPDAHGDACDAARSDARMCSSAPTQHGATHAASFSASALSSTSAPCTSPPPSTPSTPPSALFTSPLSTFDSPLKDPPLRTTTPPPFPSLSTVHEETSEQNVVEVVSSPTMHPEELPSNPDPSHPPTLSGGNFVYGSVHTPEPPLLERPQNFVFARQRLQKLQTSTDQLDTAQLHERLDHLHLNPPSDTTEQTEQEHEHEPQNQDTRETEQSPNPHVPQVSTQEDASI